MLLPAITVCDPGEADTLKSGAGCGLMVKLTEAECMMVPLVPEMVSPKVPVVLPVTIVRVALPDPLIDAGLKLAVASAGNPLTARATLPLKPLIAPTFTV